MAFADLSSAAKDVLGQLFVSGPTWDGNVISKGGRNELLEEGLAHRWDGWAFLTAAGVRMATDEEVRRLLRTRHDKRWYEKASCI